MSIIVPVYSETPITADAHRVVDEVLKEFPPNTFSFVDVTAEMQGPAPYTFHRSTGTRVLVFGSSKNMAHFSYPWDLVHTLSVAQITSKANAGSVLKAALNQYYFETKVHPKKVGPYRHWSLRDFDLTHPIAIDIETSGNLDTQTPEQVGILSVCFYQEGKWAFWNFTGENGGMGADSSDVYAVVNILRQIKRPIWHNGKFDIRVIESVFGYRMPNWFDTMLAHHVLNQAAGDHKLKHLCRQYLGAPEWETDLSKYTVGGAHYENIPVALLVEYNSWDVYWTYELYKFLQPQIMADAEAQKAFMLEMAAGDFLLDVEQKGFAVDITYLNYLDLSMASEIGTLRNDLVALTMHIPLGKKQVKGAFNPSSWQQVQQVISHMEGVTYLGSTDEKSLTKHRGSTNNLGVMVFIDKLLEYRGVLKAHSTYVKGALNRQVDGRVHGTFLIHGTTTGRLSSSGPNLQNIPRDKKFRSIYIGEDNVA